MCCGSSIDYFERLSRIIVLDNLRNLCVNCDALLFDVSFEPRCVAYCVEFLSRNGLGFNHQVFFIIINVKIQRTSPLSLRARLFVRECDCQRLEQMPQMDLWFLTRYHCLWHLSSIHLD